MFSTSKFNALQTLRNQSLQGVFSFIPKFQILINFMLPSVIESLDKAEEGDRQHYNYCTDAGPNNGKFVLQLDGKHPVQAKNTELLETVRKANEEKTKLEGKQIPEGKVTADPNVVEMGETAIAEGFKAKKDLTDLKTRATTAENRLAAEESAKTNARIAGLIGKNADAWAEHVTAKGLKYEETTIKDTEGKDVTSTMIVTKDSNGAEVKTPLKEYADKNATYVAAATAQKRRNNYNFPKEEEPEGETNEFDELEKEMKERNESARKGNVSFADLFHNRSSVNGE